MVGSPHPSPNWSTRLVASWGARTGLGLFLWPLSRVYGILVALRRWGYASGMFAVERLPVPVIVVGNAVAGGAGKTPTVIALVEHLQRRGIRVGVVSKGYGRKSRSTLVLTQDSDADQVGDEPLLIQRKTGAPVVVGTDRLDAARLLLEAHPRIQLLICDDGLQHYRLYRDLEICVFDDRGVGNGWLLPAGPLRQPWPDTPILQCGQSAMTRIVLNTGSHAALPGHRARRELADVAVDHHGQTTPLDHLNRPGRPPVLALAGIAKPDAFFAMLRQRGVTIARELALPDHGTCDAETLKATDGFQVLCTEKDAVKLWNHRPQALAVALVQHMEDDFWHQLDQHLVPHLAPHQASNLPNPVNTRTPG